MIAAEFCAGCGDGPNDGENGLTSWPPSSVVVDDRNPPLLLCGICWDTFSAEECGINGYHCGGFNVFCLRCNYQPGVE